MTKPTPGPWPKIPDLSLITRAKSFWADRAFYIEKHPDELMRWRSDEFIAEYAAMFAEAERKELLEACKLVLGAFEHQHAIDWNILEDAIRKAEGEPTT